jgi:hypothetical protein
MEQQQALQTLISAVQVATKRGAFELAETEVILSAVKVFMPKEEPKKEAKEPEPEVELKKKK